MVLRNGVKWAANPARWPKITDAPNAAKAPEPITVKGPRLHAPGEAGFR